MIHDERITLDRKTLTPKLKESLEVGDFLPLDKDKNTFYSELSEIVDMIDQKPLAYSSLRRIKFKNVRFYEAIVTGNDKVGNPIIYYNGKYVAKNRGHFLDSKAPEI